jgi:hypothetical protein
VKEVSKVLKVFLVYRDCLDKEVLLELKDLLVLRE